MDFEDLKQTWSALNDHLKENNLLNERIILDMIEKKANKSLNKLLFWDIIGIVILTGLIPYIVYVLTDFQRFLFLKITLFSALIYCVISVCWYIYKVSSLMQIDIEKSVSHNSMYIDRYKMLVKKEKLYLFYIGGGLLSGMLVLTYIEAKAPFFIWLIMGCFWLLAMSFSIFLYRKIYEKNIDSIRKNLDEIKELKEHE